MHALQPTRIVRPGKSSHAVESTRMGKASMFLGWSARPRNKYIFVIGALRVTSAPGTPEGAKRLEINSGTAIYYNHSHRVY